MADALETIKLYYDFKSPFTYLAMEPAYRLEETHRVRLRFIPLELAVREAYGGELEQRAQRDWDKVRYLYMDVRRFANERGIIIRGPQKIFDSRLALMSGLYADRNGRFRPYADRVFERFFRIDDPSIGPQPGTGLGLYIGRELAVRQGGSLRLERSEPGKGSKFVLRLPAGTPQVEPQPIGAPSALAAAPSTAAPSTAASES